MIASVTNPATVGSATERPVPDDAVEKTVIDPEERREPVKRLNPIKLKQLEERVLAAEEEIPALEESIAAAEGQMAVFTSAEEAQKLAARVEGMRLRLRVVTKEWEELAGQLEEQMSA